MDTILITGASGGIGAAIARTLSAAFPRHALALGCHRNRSAAEALAAELGQSRPVLVLQGDLGDADTVADFFRETEARLGTVTQLVNCAGQSHFGLFTDLTADRWDALMRVNLRSVFLCCHAALPGMIRKKKGCIINIGSVFGETGASCEAAYAAAKAGVIGLTKSLAQEEGPSGIRVNCVTPGLIETPMNRRLSPEELAAFLAEVPLGRPGLPEEVADAVLFLTQNPYVTGTVLQVNGGL